jgi:imidazolonepropionase
LNNCILIRGARQLLTLRGAPGVRRGSSMNDLGMIEDGSVLIQNRQVVAVGPTRRLENLREAKQAAVIPADGRIIMPGFVDSTLRLMVRSTGRQVRVPSQSRIVQEASAVIRAALQHGTTRAEVKAGGATPADDLRSLKSTLRLRPGTEGFTRTWVVRPAAEESAQDTIPLRTATFHYMARKVANGFVEVETSSETQDQAMRLLQAAAEHNLSCKLTWHGDSQGLPDILSQFRVQTLTGLCGFEAEALPYLQRSHTMLVVNGAESTLAPGDRESQIRQFLDQGGGLALASGYDPARLPVFNMQLAVALAVWRLGLTVEEAITAATINAAYASGVGACAGSLEYGKDADLLLLNLSDYRELPRQCGVNHVGMAIQAGAVVFNRIGWKAARAG